MQNDRTFSGLDIIRLIKNNLTPEEMREVRNALIEEGINFNGGNDELTYSDVNIKRILCSLPNEMRENIKDFLVTTATDCGWKWELEEIIEEVGRLEIDKQKALLGMLLIGGGVTAGGGYVYSELKCDDGYGLTAGLMVLKEAQLIARFLDGLLILQTTGLICDTLTAVISVIKNALPKPYNVLIPALIVLGCNHIAMMRILGGIGYDFSNLYDSIVPILNNKCNRDFGTEVASDFARMQAIRMLMEQMIR